MPVVGFSIESLNAKRNTFDKPLERVEVNSTPKITSVEEKTADIMGQKSLVVGFEFDIAYEPNAAKMTMNGYVMYLSNDTDAILKSWKKDKKLPVNVEVEIKNVLFRKCLAMGIDLSEQMQIPSPLGFPMFTPKAEDGKK